MAPAAVRFHPAAGQEAESAYDWYAARNPSAAHGFRDLRVATYFIWSFYSPSDRVVRGARGLGLDLVELGFDSDLRGDLIKDDMALISYVAHTLEQSRRARRFAGALEDAGRKARRELLGPAQ